jgi:hypothetical protein
MRIRLTVPKKHVDEQTLGAALEASTQVAQREIEAGDVPDIYEAIDSGSVIWRPEPQKQGFEGFDLPSQVVKRGWGDCDDLAPWLAAQLRDSGDDPDAEAIVYQSGPERWHAVVQRGNGDVDDPSRWAGMGKPGGPLPIVPPVARPGGMAVGFARVLGGTRARIEVPLVGDAFEAYDTGLAIERVGKNQWEALARVADTAFHVALDWGAADEVFARLHAIQGLLRGDSVRAIEGELGCSLGDLGEFVPALAARVGASPLHYKKGKTTTSFGGGDVANIAATILDPLGIRNMVAPLAEDFVSSYATGLANRGSSSTQQAPADQSQAQAVSGRVGRGAAPAARGASSRSTTSARGGASTSRGRSTATTARGASSQAPNYQPDPYDMYDDENEFAYGGYPSYPQQAPQYPFAAPQYPFAAQQQGAQSYDPAMEAYYAAMNPYGPDIPGTDIAPDAYGGYATPTAFSQYAAQWNAEQPRSAFDGTIMVGKGGHHHHHHGDEGDDGEFAPVEDWQGFGEASDFNEPSYE